MSKIPTAEEFLETDKDWNRTTAQMMIEFAKLHVKTCKKEYLQHGFGRYMEHAFDKYPVRVPIDEDSILNVYPLENIK